MVELKNWVNRSEAMRAMEHLGSLIASYRQKNGSVPPQSYVDAMKKSLEGQARLGNLQYRARWIEFNSPPDTITQERIIVLYSCILGQLCFGLMAGSSGLIHMSSSRCWRVSKAR